MMTTMRKFESGATRDSDESKYDYEGFLHPAVLEVYAAYMHMNRLQADGKLRDSDNWQKFFGEQHLSVCMKSLWRHFMDLWYLHRGHTRVAESDGHAITRLEACSAILFNVMAYMLWVISKEDVRK